jgi:RimJ/RimL family protein N-acetyltransferase
LLDVAVTQAEPAQVMPLVDGPGGGWTEARRTAFRSFVRRRYGGLDGPARTVLFAVVADGAVVGMIRMSRVDAPAIVQTGMWLGRSARGRGIGTAALLALLAEAAAAGADTVVADTTAGNLAAQRMLRRCGARLTPHEVSGERVDAVLTLPGPSAELAGQL